MDQTTDLQDLARRFNQDEAVWQRYAYIRMLRLPLGIELLFSAAVLDELDWIEAERECRQIMCVGKWFPTHSASYLKTMRRSLQELVWTSSERQSLSAQQAAEPRHPANKRRSDGGSGSGGGGV